MPIDNELGLNVSDWMQPLDLIEFLQNVASFVRRVIHGFYENHNPKRIVIRVEDVNYDDFV